MTRQLKTHVAKLFLPMQVSGRLLATCHTQVLRTSLFTDNLDKNPLRTASVELAIKDLFPRTEVEFAPAERDDDFSPHHLSLQMSITVVFPLCRCVDTPPFEERSVPETRHNLVEGQTHHH